MRATLEQLAAIQSQTVTETRDYLKTLAQECAELPSYYPRRLTGTNEDGQMPFDDIRQNVQVYDQHIYDQWLAREQERRRAAGERDVPYLAYGQNIFDMEREGREASERKPPEVFAWDKDTNNRYKRIILLGDPGLGKTWLLRGETRRRILQPSRENNKTMNEGQSLIQALEQRTVGLDELALPILIRLSNLAGDDRSIEEVLVAQAAGDRPHLEKLLEQKLQTQNQCVILLDAWDEVSPKLQDCLAERLIRFGKKCPDIKLILTSRIVGYNPKLEQIGEVKVLMLTTFNQNQIQIFVEKWFSHDSQSAHTFFEALKTSPRVAGLSQIPLILTILCSVYPKGKFPDRRTSIYKDCLQQLLVKWPKVDDKEEIDVDEFYEALYTSLKDQYGGDPTYLETDLKDDFQKSIQGYRKSHPLRGQDAEQLIEKAIETRFLVPDQRENTTYLYLQKRELDPIPRDPTTVNHIIYLLSHTAYILLDKGKEQFTESEFSDILDNLPDPIQQSACYDIIRNYKLGRFVQVLKQSGILKKAGPSDAEELVFQHKTFQEYLATLGLASQENCIDMALQRLYQPAWHEVLVLLSGCFKDEAQTRSYVRQCLEKTPEDLLLRPLLLAAETSSEAGERLSSQFKEQLVDKLFQIFFGVLLPWPRIFSVVSLYRKWSMPKLIAILRDDKQNRLVRREIPISLAQQGAKGAIPDMLNILRDDKQDYWFRYNIAWSLGTMGAKEAVPDMLDVFRDDKQDHSLRLWIAVNLMKIGAKEAVRDMLDILRDDKQDDLLRHSIAESLGEIGAKEAVPDMLDVFRDDKQHPCHRGQIGVSLAMMGAKEAIPYVLDFFRDEKQDVYYRWHIGIYLGKMRIKEAVPDMLDILHDDRQDDFLRKVIALSLGRMRAKEAVPDMLDIFRDYEQDIIVRISIADSLGMIGAKEAVPVMLDVLRCDIQGLFNLDVTLRASIAGSLVRMGAKEAMPDVLDILRDNKQNESLRSWVAKILGEIRAKEAVPDMLDILRDYKQGKSVRSCIVRDDKQDPSLRASIAESLGEIGAKEAIPGMLDILRNDKQDDSLRASIAESLGEIGAKEAIPDMLDILRNEKQDDSLRASIAESLGKMGLVLGPITAKDDRRLDDFIMFISKCSTELIELL